MKKRLALFTAAMIACSGLAACGSTATTGSSEQEVAESDTESDEEDVDGSEDTENLDGASGEESGNSTEGETPGNPPDGEKLGNPPDGEMPGNPSDGEKPGNPPDGEKPGNPPGGGFGGQGSSTDIDYVGAVEITSSENMDGETIESDQADENALLVSTSDDVSVSNTTVSKSGDSDGGDSCNFYGLNAAVLVKDGSMATISNLTVSSEADGANGVFSYGGNGGTNEAEGDGTAVVIRDSKITTSKDGSGGIMTTGGGVTQASNLEIETSGRSSAAIRTDRGGGTVTVDGGSYTTNGLGSPAIYSTADITVSNAKLVSNLSEGVCIEGMNKIALKNCDMEANNTDTNGNATFHDTIMIYQSMSGDADSGTSLFSMDGGSLTSKSGHVFHVTNTNAQIELSGVNITNNDSDHILLSVCADGWSGADNVAELNAKNQKLEGWILVGDDSKLTLKLSEGSSFTGAIGGEITNAKGESVSTEVGEVEVALDDDSTWTLTADTYISAFDGDVSRVVSNGYKLYVNGVDYLEQ